MSRGISDLLQEWKTKWFKHKGKYIFDRWLFKIGLLAVLIWFFAVAYNANFDLDFYSCQSNNPSPMLTTADFCQNPFYKETTWKNIEFLPPGKYGTPPDILFKSVFWTPFLVFGLVLLINHFFYNSRRLRNCKR